MDLYLSSQLGVEDPEKGKLKLTYTTILTITKLEFLKDNNVVEIPVCYKAFISLHGITARRIQFVQSSLKLNGRIKKDGRGKHSNRPIKISKETSTKVHSHIKSLRCRTAHYSLHDSKRLYLPEELNIKKLHTMYSQLNPNNPISYETYRQIFNTNYNISFGYPRTDTCSCCDEFKASLHSLELELAAVSDETQKKAILDKIKNMKIQNELHKRKAQTFYTKKREARKKCQKTLTCESICMDFQKNLKTPNISTNDVYYKRQLSYFLFNIHVLSSSDSIFFVYDETIAKKGSDEVSSMLYDFVNCHLDENVKHLTVFCDSCGGQNKNSTVFKLLYYMVHEQKRLESITVIFPIRGHSYMECDRNMALVNQRLVAEMPKDWTEHLRTVRQKPSPFVVEDCDQSKFRNWSEFFKRTFKQKCPFPTRPIREFQVNQNQPQLMFYRETYNGPWNSAVVTLPHKKQKKAINLSIGEFEFPDKLYHSRLPLSALKFQNLQELKRFCVAPEAQKYYEQLPCISENNTTDNEY